MLGLPEQIRATLFDLDGVLTDTASVHKKAWKAMFDDFLRAQAERTGTQFIPFDVGTDYLKYVDGKKREDGVRSFLGSRGIDLPDGDPDDGADVETVYGLGNRKNEMFQHTLHDDGVEVFEGSRRYLEAAADAGLGTAVVSSSANTREVLELTGLDRFVQHRVDGVTMREQNIAGKPAPDSFLRAAQLLGVEPAQAVGLRGRAVRRRRRAARATSATWSVSTASDRQRRCGATAPTSSSPISPSCCTR